MVTVPVLIFLMANVLPGRDDVVDDPPGDLAYLIIIIGRIEVREDAVPQRLDVVGQCHGAPRNHRMRSRML